MTERQQKVYDTAARLYEHKLNDDNRDAVLYKIKNTPDIEYVEYGDKMVFDLLNDVLFPPDLNNLAAKYIVSPFSVLDTKGGEWKKRRAALDAFLGSSVVGRKDGLTYNAKGVQVSGTFVKSNENETSQFDSLLTEIIYKWFCPAGGAVYDCFAGGHVRGTMAGLLGLDYVGIELSGEQVEANRARLAALGELKAEPMWIHGDSLDADQYVGNEQYDIFFSCPPYGDLEKYTDDPRDLSNMEYDKFLTAYNAIIEKGLTKLKQNRFAVFVVGDFRDGSGYYRGFVADTIRAFQAGGANLYNELVLLNSVGTAPMRAGGAFTNRKMVKLHQNVLVFFKGDPKTIRETYAPIDASLPMPEAKQTALI